MAASHMNRLFEELSGEFLECSICRNPFDEDVHVPRYYPCAHSTCQECMRQQFVLSTTNELAIRCPFCMRAYHASSRDVSNFEKNYILRGMNNFISSKKKEEFCDKCSNKLSDAFCTDCDSSLCRSCSDAIHIGNDSNHNVKFGIKKQNRPVDACHGCVKQSDIYCPKCKLFFCYTCGDFHHSDENIGTHEVLKINEENTLALGMAPVDVDGDSPMQTHPALGMRGAMQTINEQCQLLIWKLWALYQDLVAIAAAANKPLVFLVMMVILLGVYIHSFPAYTILPSEEVAPVNMICRHRTKEEVYQNLDISKINLHRTLCTFNVFHYDLRNRNKTYFVIDIDIDIAKTYRVGSVGKLFTIKMFHLNKKTNTYHKQRRMYWAVSWCKTTNDELAICLDDFDYKKEIRVSQKLISTVVMRQSKRVSFLFVVDNAIKMMDIFSPVILWKDVVFLQHYYAGQTLSLICYSFATSLPTTSQVFPHNISLLFIDRSGPYCF